MDAMMLALAKKKTQWKKGLFLAMKLDWRKLSKYYAEVTPTTCMLLLSAHMLNWFHELWSFRKLDKALDTNPDDKTSYTTQYQQSFLKYVANEYCAKHRRVPVNKHQSLPSSNHISSAPASQSCESSFHLYDLSSDDEEF
jgi:hypothetical protein